MCVESPYQLNHYSVLHTCNSRWEACYQYRSVVFFFSALKSFINSLCSLPCSIEEDFVTWCEDLWPTVCQAFGVDNTEQVNVAREYELTVHTDLPAERVFVGEPHRLGSYQNQKP